MENRRIRFSAGRGIIDSSFSPRHEYFFEYDKSINVLFDFDGIYATVVLC